MVQLKGKLSDEEAEALSDLMDTEGFAVLVTKILPMLNEARVERVITQTVAEQSDLLKLGLARAELDGARKLAKEIASLKNVARKTSAPRKI